MRKSLFPVTILLAGLLAFTVVSPPGWCMPDRAREPQIGFLLAGDDELSSSVVQAGGNAGLRYADAAEAARLAGLRVVAASLDKGLVFERADGERFEISPDETPLIETDGRVMAPVGYLAFRLGRRPELDADYGCIRLAGDGRPTSREDFLERFAGALLGRLALGAVEGRTIDRGFIALSDSLLPDTFSLVAGGRSYVPIEPIVERLGGEFSQGPAGRTLEIRGPGGLLAIWPDAPARSARRFRVFSSEPVLELGGELFVESGALADVLQMHLSSAVGESGAHLTRLAPPAATLIKNGESLLGEALRDESVRSRQEKLSRDLHRVAYLTFDDGPTASITPQVLSILEEHDIRATFFVLGSLAERNPELLRRTADLGHSIGNHSYSHIYRKVYASVDSLMAEIEQANDVLEGITGERTLLFRAPGGSYGHLKRAHYARLGEEGYKVYDWNVDSQDSKSLKVKAAEIIEAVRKQSAGKDELVILFHDAATKQETVHALPAIIAYLQEMDFEFRPIEHDVEIHARGVVKQ